MLMIFSINAYFREIYDMSISDAVLCFSMIIHAESLDIQVEGQ